MFAVVKDKQHLPCANPIDERIVHRLVFRLAHPECFGNHAWHKQLIHQGRQLDPPHPIVESIDEVGGDLNGQARLATPAGTRERDEAVASQQRFDFRGLAFATNETADWNWQVGQFGRQRFAFRCGLANPLVKRGRLRHRFDRQLGFERPAAFLVLLEGRRAIPAGEMCEHEVLIRTLVRDVGPQDLLGVFDRARIFALGARDLGQALERFYMEQTKLLAFGQNPFVVIVGQEVTAINGEVQVVERGCRRCEERIGLFLEFDGIDPEWKAWGELDGFAIDEEQVAFQLLAEHGECVAKRVARLIVGGITPYERGHFFASVHFGM